LSVALIKIVPAPTSDAAFAVVGMSKTTLSLPHLKSVTEVEATLAVQVNSPTLFSLPSKI